MTRWALAVVALVVAAMALPAAQAAFWYTEEDLASEDSMWALYERWAAHHGVVREHGEKTRRFPIFKNNARWIRDLVYGKKKIHGGKQKKFGLNNFGDMAHEEITEITNSRIEYVD